MGVECQGTIESELVKDERNIKGDSLSTKHVESTGQFFMHQTLNEAGEYISTNVESEYNCKKKNKTAQEMLSLLKDRSKKMQNNLQKIEKNDFGQNHETHLNCFKDLTQHNNNLHKRENKYSSKYCGEGRQKTSYSLNENNTCCDFDEFKPNGNDKTIRRRCMHEEGIPLEDGNCSCVETSFSTDSEDSCSCHVQKRRSCSGDQCDCNLHDIGSDTSNHSDDSKTCSSRSKCVCFSSNKESHSYLFPESSACQKQVCGTVVERCRGGQDQIPPTTVINIQNNQTMTKGFANIQDAMVDPLQLLKVEELREGLERLRMRNRNLKDFLQALENPFSLIGQPSETTTAITEISSRYSVNLAKQTRSSLLTVVKVLEKKCRSKDDIIVALADELKCEGKKKLRLSDNELASERTKLCKTASEKEEIGIVFTKKDSAIGFLVLITILISTVKSAEMPYCFKKLEEVLVDSTYQSIGFIGNSASLFISFWKINLEQLDNLAKKIVNISMGKCGKIMLSLTDLYIDGFQLTVILTFVITVTILFKFRKIISNYLGLIVSTNEQKIVDSRQVIRMWLSESLMILCREISASRVFWFIFGMSSHCLWIRLQPKCYELIDLLYRYYYEDDSLEAPQLRDVVVEETIFDMFKQLKFSRIISIFTNELQNIVNFTYYMLENIIV